MNSLFFKGLDKSFQEIVYAHNILENEFTNRREINKGGEWILDNLYLIEKEYKVIKNSINKKSYKSLPLSKDSKMKMYPRIYKVAIDMVSITEGNIDLQAIRSFVRSFEKEQFLNMEEIWALPIMLRIVLIQNIGRISNRVVYIEKERNKAEIFADALINAVSKESMDEELKKLYKLKIDFNPYFAERFLKILRNNEINNIDLYKWINKELSKIDLTVENTIFSAHKNESNNGVIIGNCINSLRNIEALNWENEFENLSQVHKILLKDPINQYSCMDFKSREYYRKNIVKLSKSLEESEISISSMALHCAEKAPYDMERPYMRHVGYYLVDEGKKELIKNIRGKLTFNEKMENMNNNKRMILYIESILFFIAFFMAGLLSLSYNHDGNFRLWKYILCGLITIIPISHIVIYILNWIISHMVPAKIIPKLDFSNDLGCKNRTIVVIPTLINSKDNIKELLQRLENYFLGNKINNLYFAILADFKDSNVKVEKGDKELVDYALKYTEELNLKYNFIEDKKFFFFLRERRFNEKEGYYLGWERKRGKLVEFNDLIRGENHTTYNIISYPIDELKKATYIITLDQDTELTRDKAKEMVGAMSHVLNFPRINEKTNTVFRGYGVLQPRIGISISSANKTIFSKVFSGETGIDTYSTSVSDVYEDLFGEGIFTGKGIYHINTFRSVLQNKIPENLILSHDLLEGSFLRAGLLTDVELIDSYPPYYNASAKRLHRWVRGDWQLLRYLKNNKLNLLRKYQIFDNLRRSLVAPNTMLLLFCSVLGILPNGMNKYFILALLTLSISMIFSIFENIITPIKSLNIESRVWQSKLAWKQLFLNFTFFPHKSILMIDAIVRTLYRLFISKKNLLQWQCAEHVEKSIGRNKYDFIKLMYSSNILSILLLCLGFLNSFALGITLLIPCIVWFLSPLIAYYVSLPIHVGKIDISEDEEQILRRISEKTWLYFKDFVNEENNYLGPDNYQEEPLNGLAHRTSPTNIGMCLMANICALDLGYIDFETCINRTYKTVGTIETLEKFHGHLYNWYDTKTKEPLRPKFVSFVDSGNLVCYYLLCAKTIEDKIHNHNISATLNKDTLNKDTLNRANELIRRLNILANATDFSVLYSKDRSLFSIGYDVENEKLNNSYYDLLASEARQGSFIAIAKGDVPKEHWFRLGRAMSSMGGHKGLVSWSGTMFEYFMPLLIMRTYNDTILDRTYVSVIKNQKNYVKDKKIPWGISESAFYEFDIEKNYQYKAFGVPGMGLKRGLKDELVISPYSTILALQRDFKRSMSNIKKLIEIGMEGKYGFYESIDYTTSRIKGSEKIVKNFMIHHEGMSLMALNNVLNNNILQKRFHDIPMVKATEILLQEKIPKSIVYNRKPKYEVRKINEDKIKLIDRKFKKALTTIPEIQLISNGQLNFMISNSGSGYCKENNLYLYRWREDVTEDNTGLFIYIKDLDSQKYWSCTYAPTMEHGDFYEVIFNQDKAKFIKIYEKILTELEVTISSEDNVEIRRIDIKNLSSETRTIEIDSYAEIVLAKYNDDLVHPAFSNLFITTEFVEEGNILIGKRTPRIKDERINYIFHTMNINQEITEDDLKIQYETARINFIGRGRSKKNPMAMDNSTLSNTTGVVLDPIISLGTKLTLKPQEKVEVIFATGICNSRGEAIRLASMYREFYNVKRSFHMSLLREQLQMEYLGYKSPQVNLFSRMASRIIFISPLMKQKFNDKKLMDKNQSNLWAFGISGDLPMVLIKIKDEKNLYKIKQLLDAHEYWRLNGLEVDLIILNEEEASYDNPVEGSIRYLINSTNCRDLVNKSGGVFVLNTNCIEKLDVEFLERLSRIVIQSDGESIGKQIEIEENKECIKKISTPTYKEVKSKEKKYYNRDLQFYNGYGGFYNAGKEYRIILDNYKNTPAPWINVISNEDFGFHISESGSSYTWNKNSRENKITTWNNDWISDTPSEVLYIKDRDDKQVWSITPKPIRDSGEYIISHGFGYSKFSHEVFSISGEETMFVPMNERVKLIKVKLKNNSDVKRKLSLCYYAHLVLGVVPSHTASKIVTFHHKDGFLYAKNPYSINFSNNYAYLAMTNVSSMSYTTWRTEFIGRGGSLEYPEALKEDKLSFTVGSGMDSCFALEGDLELEGNEQKEFLIILGQDDTLEMVEKIIHKYHDKGLAEKELHKTKGYFEELLGKVQVKTPDQSMDILLNGWLMYQTIVCRLWSRSGFYQSGGAFGFRDQLQDVMSLVFLDSNITRNQILNSASRQFIEGDVQHWWHPVVDSGIRTRFSDDLLWLPYVTLDYIKNTGDYSILYEEVSYLEDESLKEGEDERYSVSKVSSLKENIYEHCKKALERAMKFGSHNLPLMGSGDWNDGMNTVGNKGNGESVWLAWFLYDILDDFISIAEFMDDTIFMYRCKDIKIFIKENTNREAWDGQWFRRAYFDDGTPLGSKSNDECKIDSLSQSWSVISDCGDEEKIKIAMKSLEKYLVREDKNLILLLSPAFDKSDLEPGYIKSYVKGVRENGGQYTHASTWVILAMCKMKEYEKAFKLFSMINPINHTINKEECDKYRTEPYVMTADVYGVEPHMGRGGWSWYTGTSSWMYRVGLEGILGFKLKGDLGFIIDPCIPLEWSSYEIKYRYENVLYNIKVCRKATDEKNKNQVPRVYVEGKLQEDNIVKYVRDKNKNNIDILVEI